VRVLTWGEGTKGEAETKSAEAKSADSMSCRGGARGDRGTRSSELAVGVESLGRPGGQ
jgi:hypothetical protein